MQSPLDRRRFLKIMSLLPLISALGDEQRAAPALAGGQADAGALNIILLLFDTLAARHLSLHGYRRDTTPYLAQFAERATVYHAHYAAGNFTTPSTASLLTGAYPWSHRALHHNGIVTKDYESKNLFRLLSDTHHRILYPHNLWVDALLQQFRQQGDIYLEPGTYGLADHTFPDGLLSHDADLAFRALEDLLFRHISVPGSLYLSLAGKGRTLAYERIKLTEYEERYPRGVPTLGTYPVFFLLEDVMDGVMAQLRDAPQPFVAYLHLFPPHEPYCPRREFVGRFEDGWTPTKKETHHLSAGFPQEVLNQWRLEYDEYVAHTDAEFGRLHGFLANTSLLDNSIVIITSDHGQLFERGVHGHDTELLYEPVIHIPLLISRPDQRQRKDIYAPTSCVDLVPSLMEAIGKEIPAWCEGEPLPQGGSERAAGERSIFSVEAKRNPAHDPLHAGTLALLRGPYKLIRYLGYADYEGSYELYNLANDPEEMENLYSDQSPVAAELRQELEQKLTEVNRIHTRS